MYDFNEIYQAPIGDLHKQGDDDASKNLDMSDPQTFQDCLGKNEYYADYLNFFKQEMTKHGMRAVLKEYVFKGDSRADDIVARLFSGKVAFFRYGTTAPSLTVDRLASSHDSSRMRY